MRVRLLPCHYGPLENFSAEPQTKSSLCKKARRFPSPSLFSCNSMAVTLLLRGSVNLYLAKDLKVRSFS